MATLSTGTRTSRPSRRTRASFGASSISARIARRARSMLRDSSHCARANRNVTVAASDHSPMAMAPATAMSISVLMSRANSRAADQARRAQYQPPAAVDAASSAPVTAGGTPAHSSAMPAAAAAPEATRNASRAPPDGDGDARRGVVVEPRPHAGGVHGLGDGRRRELRGVVRDAEGAPDHVGAHRFEPLQRLEPALEDGHFLVAVHALDAEHGLRVDFADGAGWGRVALIRAWDWALGASPPSRHAADPCGDSRIRPALAPSPWSLPS